MHRVYEGPLLAQSCACCRATVDVMDEARAVLARLDRIEALEREGAPPGVLLEELRGLVHEAEAWAKLEGDERAKKAVGDCDAALAQPVS
jgi:hypothetical protein